MSDITKCPGGTCLKRFQCERFTRPAHEYQSWADFYLAIDFKQDGFGLKCDYFMPEEKERRA